MIVIDFVILLFPGFGSGSDEPTVAVVFKLPAPTGIIEMDTEAVPPVARDPQSQRTTGPAAQFPWLATADTTIGSSVNVSSSVTCDTPVGPMFFTVKFKSVFVPVVDAAGAVEETEISAGVALKFCTVGLRSM